MGVVSRFLCSGEPCAAASAIVWHSRPLYHIAKGSGLFRNEFSCGYSVIDLQTSLTKISQL